MTFRIETPEDDQPAIVITRGQLAAMTGRELTPEFVARLDEIWPDSSIPEALATIGDSIAEETGASPTPAIRAEEGGPR